MPPGCSRGHLAFDFCKVVSSTSAAAGGIEVEMPVLQQQKMQIGNGNVGKALESIRTLAKILDHFDILTLSQVVSSAFLLQLSFWECFSGDLIDPDFYFKKELGFFLSFFFAHRIHCVMKVGFERKESLLLVFRV